MTLTLRDPLYISGSQRSVWFAQENTGAAGSTAFPSNLKTNPPTLGSPPSATPTYLGQTNSPSIQRARGGALGFAVGQETAAWSTPGGIGPHTIDVQVRAGVGVAAAIRNFLPCGGLSGIMGKPDWALYVNTDETIDGTGWMDVYRYCKLIKCAPTFTLGDNAAEAEIVWDLTFLALWGPQAGTVLSAAAAASALSAGGVPLYGTNISSVSCAGYEFKRDLTGLQASLDFDIVPRGRNNDLGDNVALSMAPVGLKSRRRAGSGNMSASAPFPAAMREGSATARFWGDIVILVTNASASTVGSGSIVERITLQNARSSEESEEAAEQDADAGYGVGFVFTDMVVATS